MFLFFNQRVAIMRDTLSQWFSFRSIREIVVLLLIVFLIRTFGFGLYQVPTGSMETTMLVGERFFADKFTILFSKPQRGDIVSFNDPEYGYSDNYLKRLFQEYVWGPSNWTKRVIGVPGDRIKGVVEDGKPVIYLNGKKLDEPYLNKYPLIAVWRQDPNTLKQQINQEAARLLRNKQLDSSMLDSFLNYALERQLVLKSFDPSVSYMKQPFYRIDSRMIFKKADGSPTITYPNTPINPHITKPNESHNFNYWNGTDDFQVELDDHHYWLMGDNRLGSKDCRFFGPVDGRLIHGKILFRIWSIDSDESWWIIDLIKHPIDFWSRIRWNRFFQFVR